MRPVFSAILLGAATVVAVACGPRTAAPSPTSTLNDTAAPTVAAATTTPATTSVPTASSQPASAGAISGLTGYPAEGHPGLTVYAISTTDKTVWFSVDIPRGTDPAKPPYTISGVRPGTYNLFAAAEGNERTGGAYTQYVKCGMNASCSDHTLIDVTVRAGETVRDIEVSDWYAPASSYPVRPR
jgi:hypothetical protein